MRKYIYNKKSIIIALFAVLSLAMCLCAAVLFGGLKTKAFAAEGQDIDDISAYTLADYVTVQNKDVGAEESFSTADGSYKYYSFPTPYSTTSMVYRFKYTSGAATYVALRDTKGGWGGYQFIFNGNAVQYYLTGTKEEKENPPTVSGILDTQSEQIIELGAIDTTTEGKTYIFVKINGELRIGKIRNSISSTGCGFGIWAAGSSGTFKQVDNQPFKLSTGELEKYVTVQNKDVGADESFSTADGSYKYYTCVTPTPYATNSMAYRFKYTSGAATYVALRDTNGGWGGYQFILNGAAVQYKLTDEKNEEPQTVGNLIDTGAEQIIEIGAVDIISSGKTFLYVKINDKYKITAIRTSTALSTDCGFGIWGAGGSGTFKQVDDKTFPSNCFENYETVTNADFGTETFTINGNDNLGFRTFVKETANATTSVVYKFNYTHLGGATYIAMRDNGSWGGYQFIIDGNGTVTYGGETVGNVDLQSPCNYELGAIDLTTGGTYVYAIINGEKTFEKYVDTLANTGCGFSVWASALTGEFGLPLCDYVTFQNLDAGAPIAFRDDGFANRYVYETANDTSSAVYKFRYTPSVATYVALRNSSSGGWGKGYRFIFVNGAVQYYTDNKTFAESSQKTVYNVMPQDQASFLVEIGAIDVEGKDLTLLFVKVDGISVVSEYVTKLADTDSAFGVWGEKSSGLFEQADLYSAYGGKNISVFEGFESSADDTILVNDGKVRSSADNFGKESEFVFNVKPFVGTDSALSYSLYKKDGSDTSYIQFLVFFNSSATVKAGQIRIITTVVNGANSQDLQAVTAENFPTKSLSSEQDITVYTKVSYVDSVLNVTVKARDIYGNEAVFCDNAFTDLADEYKEVFDDTCGLTFWANQDTYIGDASKYITVTDGETVDYINYIRAIELVGKLPEAKGLSGWDHVGYRLDGEKFGLSEIYRKFLAIDSSENHTLSAVYQSNYALKDGNGNSLGEGSVEYGKTIDYDVDSLTNANGVFVGYLYNGKLYRTLDDVLSQKVDGNAEITLKTVALSLEDGASIKLVGGEKATIRFSAKIDKENADKFVKNFGMLFTTSETLKTANGFTLAALGSVGGKYYNINKLDGMNYSDFIDGLKYSYSIYLDGISLGNYGVKYTARAYVVVEYADGTEEYIYTPYSEENNARSVYRVATAAISDSAKTYNNEILKKYINGVIDLDTDFNLSGYERDYTVDVVSDGSGSYTVTVTPKNGFDVRKIGSIYVGGEYIPARNAAVSADGKGTFVINEDDMSSIIVKKIEENLAKAAEKEKSLEILAYEGPQIGVKFNSDGTVEYTGVTATLSDLEEYMAAGFDSWIVIDASYGNSYLSEANGGAKTAAGTVISGGHPEYDIYWALDLAAEYANKYGKACKVYVTIPALVSLDVTESGYNEISAAYTELIGYVDKYNGKNSPVNGKNQLAGFLLKDEPTVDEYDKFAALYDYIAYADTVNGKKGLGALSAGYDFECALLQSYTVSDYIGGDFSAYVKKYAELLKDTTISFDNYPFNYQSRKSWFNGSSVWSMENSWFFDMQTIRSGKNKAYGTCIQSYVAGEYNSRTPYKRVDKEEEISMQVYTALAYGFTKLNYFTYWQRNSDNIKQTTEVFQNNMVRWNDYSDWSKGHTTTSLYNYGKNVNEEAKSLFNVLKYFTNNGVQLIVGTDSGNNFGSATTTNASNPINVTSSLDMVVGGFKCGAYNGYLAVNVDLPHNERTSAATFAFSAAYTKAVVYENGVASVKTLKNGTLSLDIGCGEGIFIVPVA